MLCRSSGWSTKLWRSMRIRIVFGSLGLQRGSGSAPAKPGPTGAVLRVANSMPRSPGQFFRAEVNRDALQKRCLEHETVAQRENTHSIRKFRAPEGLQRAPEECAQQVCSIRFPH